MNKQLFSISMLIFAGVLFMAMYHSEQSKPWDVPAEYVKMKNPIASDSESLKAGKRLYNKHCKSCHGNEGLGDGTKAAQLDTPCGDFSTEAFQKQSDGSLFYKTKFGRDEMPSYEKKIPYEEDMWHVINYIRTF